MKEHYDHIYNNQAEYGQYGHDNHSRNHLTKFFALNPTSVIDIGCGHNEFIIGLNVSTKVGVDISCPNADCIAPAHKLPFGDKAFDMLTSFDCLEHLDPEDIDKSLAEMQRVSRRLFVTVCFKKETCYRVDDKTLHPSANSERWWTSKLNEYAILDDIYIFTEGSQGDHALYIGEWKSL